LCRGRYEGPDPFLGRRGSPPGPAAIAASMAPAPPYVCGAGTRRLHLRVDMKSAHASECRHRQHKKVEKIPLTGVVCLLTTGGLIRVRWDRICADGSPAGPLGLPQPTKDHEGTAPS